MTPSEIIEKVKQAVAAKYAWPGGYLYYYIVMADGEAMSIDAATENIDLIVMATMANDQDGWAATGVAINWEDDNLVCCQSGKLIKSAYGKTA
jgi:hypothetical protein